jgi:hypothetical protein
MFFDEIHKTISFFGTVSAGSELTLASQRIDTPYSVTQIVASFALGCNRLVQLEFFISTDATTPSTGKPSGSSLLGDYGQISYLVGDDQMKTIFHNVHQPQGGSYVKVYANNTDAFDHAVDVQVTIRLYPRK